MKLITSEIFIRLKQWRALFYISHLALGYLLKHNSAEFSQGSALQARIHQASRVYAMKVVDFLVTMVQVR